MSFNEIILPQNVIAEIYKNNLVQITGEQKSKPLGPVKNPVTQAAAIPYLGTNLKNVLVFVNYPEDVFLPEEQLEFLTKILKACKLDVGDIAIINTAKQTLPSMRSLDSLRPKSILIFGECLTSIVSYTESAFFLPANIEDIEVMTAPGLDKFYESTTESKQLKSKLWSSLQQFFKL